MRKKDLYVFARGDKYQSLGAFSFFRLVTVFLAYFIPDYKILFQIFAGMHIVSKLITIKYGTMAIF